MHEDSLDKRLKDQLILARQKREKAEAFLQAVSEEVDRAHQDAAHEIITEARQNLTESDHMPLLGVRIRGHAKAYPFPLIADKGLINDSLGPIKVLVTLDPVFSAAVAFDRTLSGEELHFRALTNRKDGLLLISDEKTRSVWQALTGRAIDGPLAGQALEEVDSDLSTTFNWKKLYPSTEFYS